LTNPNFVLTSDTLLYNTDTKVADIVSPTDIIYDQETDIHTSRGWYNTQTEQSMLLDRSVVHHQDGKMMTGDTIYYDKKKGFGEVLGDMTMSDTTQQMTLTGNYGQMWEEDNRGYATDSALMIDWSDTTHITYIHADTLFTEELHYTDSALMDSTYRRARAYFGVRVYRDDMQMTCDSLVYLGSDSTIHLYTKPICWSENQQIAADSMVVYVVNGTVDHTVGNGNALCVMHDTIDYFNQMSGKQVVATLEDGEVKLVDMDGNALTIYYAKESDGSFVGMNTTESSHIRMYVKQQKIDHMLFTKETTGVLYPMDQIPGGMDRLAIFFWADEIRPTDPEDVFRRTKE
jgi:lipopolysaccharide export system protein LptA